VRQILYSKNKLQLPELAGRQQFLSNA